MGISVLAPDINESALDFRSVGDKIRFGLLAVRNVGEGAIRSILDCRQRHGRFRSLFEFSAEVDSRAVNKRVLESLIKSGALDSLGWRRSQLMALCDAAIEHGQKRQRDRESGQRGLFTDLAAGLGAVEEPGPSDLPEWPLEQLLGHEKETLGYYLSGHPLDRFSAELARFSKRTVADLIGAGTPADCAVAGIVTEFRTRRTKKGDLMAVFKLEDLTGAVETVVFPSLYARVEALLTTDAPIHVTGRFEIEGEGSGKIIAGDVQPLGGIAERNARTLRIRAELSRLAPESAQELYRLLERNRGETGIEVELYHPRDFRVTIQSSDFVKVRSSPELVRQIEAICGSGSVLVVD
jgi:DNA polymerase-3 subunit alpha